MCQPRSAWEEAVSQQHTARGRNSVRTQLANHHRRISDVRSAPSALARLLFRHRRDTRRSAGGRARRNKHGSFCSCRTCPCPLLAPAPPHNYARPTAYGSSDGALQTGFLSTRMTMSPRRKSLGMKRSLATGLDFLAPLPRPETSVHISLTFSRIIFMWRSKACGMSARGKQGAGARVSGPSFVWGQGNTHEWRRRGNDPAAESRQASSGQQQDCRSAPRGAPGAPHAHAGAQKRAEKAQIAPRALRAPHHARRATEGAPLGPRTDSQVTPATTAARGAVRGEARAARGGCAKGAGLGRRCTR